MKTSSLHFERFQMYSTDEATVSAAVSNTLISLRKQSRDQLQHKTEDFQGIFHNGFELQIIFVSPFHKTQVAANTQTRSMSLPSAGLKPFEPAPTLCPKCKKGGSFI